LLPSAFEIVDEKISTENQTKVCIEEGRWASQGARVPQPVKPPLQGYPLPVLTAASRSNGANVAIAPPRLQINVGRISPSQILPRPTASLHYV
jgi:hypothetical protein